MIIVIIQAIYFEEAVMAQTHTFLPSNKKLTPQIGILKKKKKIHPKH
jgi:hypothetical protein